VKIAMKREITFVLVAIAALSAAAPKVALNYNQAIRIRSSGNLSGRPTQMAWGPDGRLYMATDNAGVLSYAYNADKGLLSGGRVAAPGVSGVGLGFAGDTMYCSTLDGNLVRLRDQNKNGVYGETGETKVAIVKGIPTGDHAVDQILISGKTLYVGIGLRTINGRKGEWTSGSRDDFGGSGFWGGGIGKTWGDSAWGGTISWIRNLDLVPDTEDAANPYPVANRLFSEQFILDAAPFSDATNKLVVHSAGTRNPFGLAFDKEGTIFFTVNFNRTNTNGDGTSGFGLHGDVLDGDFSNDVNDQLFRASKGADYGYANDNWRGVATMLTPGTTGYKRFKSITFDNLWNKGPYKFPVPGQPQGLGPHSSSNGCAFGYGTWLPTELQGRLFIARWNTTVTEANTDPKVRSLTYQGHQTGGVDVWPSHRPY
jgi:glucose/arabinose dehydrogenase